MSKFIAIAALQGKIIWRDIVSEIVIANSHLDTWLYCMKQLELAVPADNFKKWVRPLCLMSSEGDVLCLSAPDQLTRDWAEDRLSATIQRYVQGFNSNITNVTFSVCEILPVNDMNTQDQFSQIINPITDYLRFTTSYQSLWESLVRSDRNVAINSYSFRHIPYVGASAWLAYIGFCQERFLKSSGQNFATTFSDVARWTGLSIRTIDRLLDSGKLSWFVAQTGVSAVTVKGKVQRLTCFDMPSLISLTPGDATDLREYLIGEGIQRNPVAVLEHAISLQPAQILHFPFRPPASTDLQPSKGAFSVLNLVEGLLGDVTQEISNLCSRLQHHLTGATFLNIPWYFLKNSLPSLTADMGACVLLANTFTYHNIESGEQRNDFWMSIENLAGRLGTSPEQVRSWFPKVITTCPGSVTKPNDLSRYIMRIDYKKVDSSYSWQFVVKPLLTLSKIDDQALSAAALLIDNIDQQLLFSCVDSVFVNIDQKSETRFLSTSLAQDSVFVNIVSLLDSVFVSIDLDQDSVFVSILKILKAFKNTLKNKDSSSNPATVNSPAKVIPAKDKKAEEEFEFDIQKMSFQIQSPEVKMKVVKNVPAGVFASQIIASAANPRVQNPLAVAVSNVTKNPLGWAEGAASDLAGSPAKTAAAIRDHLKTCWCSPDSLYGKVFAEVSLDRIRTMADILGIDVGKVNFSGY